MGRNALHYAMLPLSIVEAERKEQDTRRLKLIKALIEAKDSPAIDPNSKDSVSVTRPELMCN